MFKNLQANGIISSATVEILRHFETPYSTISPFDTGPSKI